MMPLAIRLSSNTTGRQIASNLAPVKTKAYPRCLDLQANLLPLFRANLDVYLPFLDLSEK